jgi:hypothetical protein
MIDSVLLIIRRRSEKEYPCVFEDKMTTDYF